MDQINWFTFWYSVVSTAVGILLLVASVGLLIKTWLDSKNKKVQIKIWMQDANGISTALQRVIRDNIDKRYSSTNDMGNAIWSIQASAFALYQSLYEERCVSEKDFIEDQKDVRKKIKKIAEQNLKQGSNQVSSNPTTSTD